MLGLLPALAVDGVAAAAGADEDTWPPLPLPPPRTPVGTEGMLKLALSDGNEIDAADKLVDRPPRFKLAEGPDIGGTESDGTLVSKLRDGAETLSDGTEMVALLRLRPGTGTDGAEMVGKDKSMLVEGTEMLLIESDGMLTLNPGEVSEMLGTDKDGAPRLILVDGTDKVGIEAEGSEIVGAGMGDTDTEGTETESKVIEGKVESRLVKLKEIDGSERDGRPRLVLGTLRVEDGRLTLGRVIEGALNPMLVEGRDKVGPEMNGNVMLAETSGIEALGRLTEGTLSEGAVMLPGSTFDIDTPGSGVVSVGIDRLTTEGTLKLATFDSDMPGTAGTERLSGRDADTVWTPGRDIDPAILSRFIDTEPKETVGRAPTEIEPIVDCTLTSDSVGAETAYVGIALGTLVLICVTLATTSTARF